MLRSLVRGVATAAVFLFVPMFAGATSFTVDANTATTAQDPIPFTLSNGAVGFINPITDLSGAGSITTTGSVLLPLAATQDLFVFEIELSAGSDPVDEIGASVAPLLGGGTNFLNNPVGAGFFTGDAGPGVIAPTAVSSCTIANFLCGSTGAGLFDFGTPLAAGERSVRLFVTYSPEGAVPAVPNPTASFMVSSGLNATVQGPVVPEPSTALLTALGLLGTLGFARSRARHH